MSAEDAAARLARKLELLKQRNPEGYARVMRLLDRMTADPPIGDAELAEAIREALGDPPGSRGGGAPGA